MSAARPLAGTRVLDVTTFLAGPLATRALADLGADVVKVEPPGGDPTRAGWTGEGDAPPYWQALHRGRRSVVLDLGGDEGRAAFLAMAREADVVVENLRPGVMTGFGLGPDVLRAANDRLVTCSITGFADPDLAGAAAVDGAVQAWAGALALNEAWAGTPLPLPVQVADIAGGAVAAQGVLAALVARASTGRGAHVAVTLEDALGQWLAVTDRSFSLRPPNTLVLEGSDGGRFLVQTPMHFAARFLELIGADDPRWATREGRREHAAELVEVARRAAATAPAGEWLDRLRAAGIPAAAVRPVPEGAARSPWTFDGDRNTDLGPPPGLGEHDAEVLG